MAKKSSVVSKAKAKKVTLDIAQPAMFFALDALHKELAVIEKKVKLSSHGFERYASRVSTGMLCIDMYIDGGLVPGGWYTFSGGEQSCKSTLTMTVMASCIKFLVNGVCVVFDYEGSSDPTYIRNILRSFKLNIDELEIFGLVDEETGEYVVQPRLRYYAPDVGTKFFDYMAMVRRRLPDKVVNKDGSAFLYYANTKENAKLCAGKYDKSHFSKHNEFKVPAPDSHMQFLGILDSLPAMLPDLQDDDEVGNGMAVQARMFSDGIKRFRGAMRRKMITILAVNQLRQKPATMYGDPAYEPCGDAVKFYCYEGDTLICTDSGLVSAASSVDSLAGQAVASLPSNAYVEAAFEVPSQTSQKNAAILYAGGSRLVGSANHSVRAIRSRPRDKTLTAPELVWQVMHSLSPGDFVISSLPKTSLPSEEIDGLRIEFADVVTAGAAFINTAYASQDEALAALPDDVRATSEKQLIAFVIGMMDSAKPDIEGFVLNAKAGSVSLVAELLRLSGLYVSARSSGRLTVRCIPGANIFSLAHRELIAAELWLDVLAKHSTKHQRTSIVSAMHRCAVVSPYLYSAMDDALDRDHRDGIITSRTYDLCSQHVGYLEDIQAELSVAHAPCIVIPVPVSDVTVKAMHTKLYDCNIPTTSSLFTNGILSHNSDVRWRLASRAVPQGWKGEHGIVEEPSVEYKDSVDQYRFIGAKSIKNKLGGIPNQATMMRLWQSDGKGDARGFDPVFDTYTYLKTLGLVSGPRNKIKFEEPTPFAGAKSVTWDEFRVLVNGDKKQVSEVCSRIGAKKPGRIRGWCFDLCNSDNGRQLVRDSIVRKIASKKDDDSDD